MTQKVRLSSAARADILTAKQWYVDRSVPGLDRRFEQELEHIFQRIADFPSAFPVIHRGIRRANLHRFPYAVFYHQRSEEPYVLAVTHHARHPRAWKDRR